MPQRGPRSASKAVRRVRRRRRSRRERRTSRRPRRRPPSLQRISAERRCRRSRRRRVGGRVLPRRRRRRLGERPRAAHEQVLSFVTLDMSPPPLAQPPSSLLSDFSPVSGRGGPACQRLRTQWRIHQCERVTTDCDSRKSNATITNLAKIVCIPLAHDGLQDARARHGTNFKHTTTHINVEKRGVVRTPSLTYLLRVRHSFYGSICKDEERPSRTTCDAVPAF